MDGADPIEPRAGRMRSGRPEALRGETLSEDTQTKGTKMKSKSVFTAMLCAFAIAANAEYHLGDSVTGKKIFTDSGTRNIAIGMLGSIS